MLHKILILTIVTLSTVSLRAANPTTAPSTQQVTAPRVTPTEFEKLTADKDNVILDVRTPEEFSAGHIPGAVNINYKSKDFPEKVASLDKSKTYLVYCAVGGRSTGACAKLTKLDFPHLYNLDGGIIRWQSEGKKVEKE